MHGLQRRDPFRCSIFFFTQTEQDKDSFEIMTNISPQNASLSFCNIETAAKVVLKKESSRTVCSNETLVYSWS